MQSELLLLFAEYPFYTADDVETYLSLLQSVPDYVQGLLSYESEKSAAGLFMEKEDAKKSAQQCREILTKEADVYKRQMYSSQNALADFIRHFGKFQIIHNSSHSAAKTAQKLTTYFTLYHILL